MLQFATWGEVQDYAENDPDGRDLQPFVDVISRLCDEARADVTVSTVHRAKGREWPTVRIANDFLEPEDPDSVDATGEPLPGPIDPAEARLAYVAVTHSHDRLDLGGLSWINRHPTGNPEQPKHPAKRSPNKIKKKGLPQPVTCGNP